MNIMKILLHSTAKICYDEYVNPVISCMFLQGFLLGANRARKGRFADYFA
jgi:hypothetical protein